jgi:hypothetical protein
MAATTTAMCWSTIVTELEDLFFKRRKTLGWRASAMRCMMLDGNEIGSLLDDAIKFDKAIDFDITLHHLSFIRWNQPWKAARDMLRVYFMKGCPSDKRAMLIEYLEDATCDTLYRHHRIGLVEYARTREILDDFMNGELTYATCIIRKLVAERLRDIRDKCCHIRFVNYEYMSLVRKTYRTIRESMLDVPTISTTVDLFALITALENFTAKTNTRFRSMYAFALDRLHDQIVREGGWTRFFELYGEKFRDESDTASSDRVGVYRPAASAA